MLKERFRVIIYDCDGVLFDSKEANEVFYNHILMRFGLPKITREQLEFVQVVTALEAIDFLFQSESLREQAREYLKIIDNQAFIPFLRLEPNIREVLALLHQSYSLAIATNRGTSMTLLIEEFDLKGLFDLVITSLDVRKPKPDPEPLLKIIDNFGITPGEALFIGDSEVDSTVSNRVGIPFISYKHPEIASHCCIQNHLEILDILGIK